MDMIKDFLYSEMSIEDLYKEVIFFINSDEIQKGEFEGNEYILQYSYKGDNLWLKILILN